MTEYEAAKERLKKAEAEVEKAKAEVEELRWTRIVPEKNLEPGIRFTRLVRCLAMAHGDHKRAAEIAEAQYGDREEVTAILKAAARYGEVSDLAIKAAVSFDHYSSDDEQSWASPLAEAHARAGAVEEFVRFVMQQTVVEGATATHIPFRTKVAVSDDGNETVLLTPEKKVAVVTVHEETLRDGNPSAERLLRDQMAQALANRVDEAFRAEIGDETTPVYLADEGGLEVETAHQLSPHHFEHGLVVIKLSRTVNWAKRS